MGRLLQIIALVHLSCACGQAGGPGGTAMVEPTRQPDALPALPMAEALSHEHIPGGHLVAFLATNKFDSLYSDGLTQGIPGELIGAGYAMLSVDLPCHGADRVEEKQLECWRRRLEAGEHDLFTRFCAGFSATLDALAVTEMSVVGQSRGAYVAAMCAAFEPRIRSLVLLAPVTNLQRLEEFDGYVVDQAKFGLNSFAPHLHDRRVLVRINSVDDRVGTDDAIAFAAAAAADLDILDREAHIVPNDGQVVRWLLENVGIGPPGATLVSVH